MTELTQLRTSHVEALQVNRGVSLKEGVEQCSLGSQSIIEDHLIVCVDITTDSVFLLNLDSTPRMPIKVGYNELYAAIDSGTLEIIDIEWPAKAIKPFDELTVNEQKKANARFDVIAPLLDDLESTLLNGYGQNCFQQVIDDSGRSKQYVYDCLIGYLYYGQRKAGLALPIGKNIFHIPKEQRTVRVKQGKPNAIIPAGKVLDEYDFANFEKAKRLYQKKNGPKLKRVYEMMLAKHYFKSRKKLSPQEQLRLNEQYRIELKPATERPTFAQFYYWMQKQNGNLPASRDKSRKNQAEFAKDLAGRTGNAFESVIAFGQAFELDETPFDEELVSLFDPTRQTKIGKATLYFVIDRLSKYIVGLFITTEAPSYNTVRQALFFCGTDKSDFLLQYGFDPSVICWKYFGIPNTLFVDNAEFRNRISEGAICDLQCMVKFARRGRGDDKPNVEQLFNVFSGHFQGLSKAHQTKSLADIHNQLARKHACLTINELYIIAIVYINYHNNYRLIPNFSFDRAMLQDGVEPIPAKIVEWSLKYRPGYLIHYPKQELYLKLLPRAEASVGQRGVYFSKAGLMYNCDWTRLSGRQDRKDNRNKVLKYDCRYNENFIDVILLSTEDGLKVGLLDSSQAAYTGLSMHEVKLQKQHEKSGNASLEQRQLEYKLGLHDLIENITNQAKNERTTGPIPNISAIKDNRRFEALINRFSDANEFLRSIYQDTILDGQVLDPIEAPLTASSSNKTRDAFNDDED